MKGVICCLIFYILLPVYSFSQENTGGIDELIKFPGKFLTDIDKRTSSLEGKLNTSSISYLQKLSKQESKIQKYLSKLDPSTAQQLFPNGIQSQYAAYIERLKSDSAVKNFRASGNYYPNTDSMQMALAYLKANPQLLSKAHISPAQLQTAIGKLSLLQGKLNYSDQINQFVAQRRQQFQQVLSKYTDLPNKLKSTYEGYKAKAAYYAEQVKVYKEELNDPDKVVSLSIGLLYKVPSFSNFVKSNSILSSLFNRPSNVSSDSVMQGLQTRKQIQAMMETQMGPGAGVKAFSSAQSSIQSAQGVVDGLRDKLNASGSGNLTMPDFKGNDQRTKSFLHRIEYGANLQITRSTYFFPISTDIAASAGYRLNKSNIVGVALAYRIGWGSDIHHIQVTSQGIGLRSFVDIKIKSTWFFSGGFEYNYQQPFNPLHVFDELNDWTKSGLLGFSKIVQMKSKIVKKSKVSLLWDFLSYYQVPRTQPFVIRVGYSF